MSRAGAYTLAAVVVAATGLYAATDGLRALTAEAARRVQIQETRPAVPPFVVEGLQGRRHALRPDPNQVVMVEFIYTTCPTICQTAGGDFAALRDRAVDRGLPVRMLSVSFDPAADGPSELRDYADRHGADGDVWSVARLRPADLQDALRFFRVKAVPDGWGGYQHNAAVLLINPDGHLVAAYDTGEFDRILAHVEQLS